MVVPEIESPLLAHTSLAHFGQNLFLHSPSREACVYRLRVLYELTFNSFGEFDSMMIVSDCTDFELEHAAQCTPLPDEVEQHVTKARQVHESTFHDFWLSVQDLHSTDGYKMMFAEDAVWVNTGAGRKHEIVKGREKLWEELTGFLKQLYLVRIEFGRGAFVQGSTVAAIGSAFFITNGGCDYTGTGAFYLTTNEQGKISRLQWSFDNMSFSVLHSTALNDNCGGLLFDRNDLRHRFTEDSMDLHDSLNELGILDPTITHGAAVDHGSIVPGEETDQNTMLETLREGGIDPDHIVPDAVLPVHEGGSVEVDEKGEVLKEAADEELVPHSSSNESDDDGNEKEADENVHHSIYDDHH